MCKCFFSDEKKAVKESIAKCKLETREKRNSDQPETSSKSYMKEKRRKDKKKKEDTPLS